MPLPHDWPVAQAWPHSKQFAGSFLGLTQVPLQRSWPGGQLPPSGILMVNAVQAPERQTSFEPQVFAQLPQFPGSSWRFVQTPVHWVWPAGQPAGEVPPPQPAREIKQHMTADAAQFP